MNPMIDLILAVENTREFHLENLQRNKKHYSFENRLFGLPYIETIQKNSIFFNPYVKIEDSVSCFFF